MKPLVFNILFANLLMWNVMASPMHIVPPSEKDTIILKLKNRSKMIIVTNKDQDISELKELDLNALMQNLDSAMKGLNLRVEILGNEMDGQGNRDTSIVIRKRVVKTDGGQKITITENRYGSKIISIRDTDVNSQSTNRHRTYRGFSDELVFDLGFTNYLEGNQTPDQTGKPYGLNASKSVQVGFGYIHAWPLSKRFSVASGLNITWDNYRFEDNFKIVKGDSVLFEAPDNDRIYNKSKLLVTTVNVPIQLRYQSKSGFRVAAGVFGGYRVFSHSKVKYNDNGKTQRDKEQSNFYLNNFNYGVRAEIGYSDISLYGQYHINPLFSSRGPEVNSFSLGLSFALD